MNFKITFKSSTNYIYDIGKLFHTYIDKVQNTKVQIHIIQLFIISVLSLTRLNTCPAEGNVYLDNH